MKLARILQTAALILLALLAGGCAALAPKTAAIPLPSFRRLPPPARNGNHGRPSRPKRSRLEEAKTIIPVEERTSAAVDAQVLQTQEKDEATISIEDAMTFYEEAVQARARGDLDTAIKALDEAYGIILKLNIPPDSSILTRRRTTSASSSRRGSSRSTPCGGIRSSNNHKSLPARR